MLIQRKHSLTLLSLLIAIIIFTSVLVGARAAPQELVVQKVTVSPKVVKIGETVTVEAEIRNKGKNTTTCNIIAYVGEYLVEEFNGITIPARDSFSLLFTIDTSFLEWGDYVIDVVVEQAESEEVFDLETISVWQEFVEEEPTETETPEQEPTETETAEQEIGAGFDMFYLLLGLPAGAAVTFFVWRWRRTSRRRSRSASPTA